MPHPSRDWKTICGFKWNAKRLAHCLLQNELLRGSKYTLAVTINVKADLTIEDHRKWWPKVCTKLRKIGVVALWVREVTKRTNRIHYHLICATAVDADAIKNAVREADPKYAKLLNQYVHPITGGWTEYVVKHEKTSGFYKEKIVLFAPHVDLKKVGEIGDFWMESKDTLWKAHAAKQQRLHDLKDCELVNSAAQYMSDLTGEPIGKIKWTYAKWMDAEDKDAIRQIQTEAAIYDGDIDYWTLKPPDFVLAP